jgi:hypothetical protein
MLKGGENVVVKSAAEALDEEKDRLRMTTGIGDLDGLIDSIAEGFFYLFYGEQKILDAIVYRLIVNCTLPIERGGFQAKGIYFNNTDYYTGKTILDPSEIGCVAKQVGADPQNVFSNTDVATAYNEQRQLIVAKQISELISEDHEIRLIVAHNLTRFLTSSKKPQESSKILKQVVNLIWEAASKANIALVATGDALSSGRGFIPRPAGGNFIRHKASIITYFKMDRGDSVKAYLIKHPCKKTPESATLTTTKGGVDLMGRITPSFRQRYEALVSDLRSSFQACLIDLGHRQAFDLLLKDAWRVEQAAMGNSNLPTVIDALNITANIHNRKVVEHLRGRIEEYERKLQELSRRVEELEAHLRVVGEMRGSKDG